MQAVAFTKTEAFLTDLTSRHEVPQSPGLMKRITKSAIRRGISAHRSHYKPPADGPINSKKIFNVRLESFMLVNSRVLTMLDRVDLRFGEMTMV